MKKMTVTLVALFSALVLFGMTASAGALTIIPGISTPWDAISKNSTYDDGNGQWSGSDIDKLITKQGETTGWDPLFPNNPEAGDISHITGTSFSGSQLYKLDFPEESEYEEFLIAIGQIHPFNYADPIYLIVKDGNQIPIWYLFDLKTLGWNGKEEIKGEGFWEGNGAISHIAVYGTPVPEPTTMLLLGLGLVGLAGVGRKFKK